MKRNFSKNNYHYKRGPESLSSLLTKSFTPRITRRLAYYSSLPPWSEVVGEELAKKSYPERIIRTDILVIKVLDPVWAQELSFKKSKILEDIAKLSKGYVQLSDIRFISGNPRAFQKNKPRSI